MSPEPSPEQVLQYLESRKGREASGLQIYYHFYPDERFDCAKFRGILEILVEQIKEESVKVEKRGYRLK